MRFQDIKPEGVPRPPLLHAATDMTQQLCSRMVSTGYKYFFIERVCNLITNLPQKKVDGIARFIAKLKNSVRDREAFADILVEGEFASLLAKNGFTEVHLEPQSNGPDLKGTWNNNVVYFEVKRRRPSGEDKEVETASRKGEASWATFDRTENVIDKIQQALHQFIEGEINVIVLWSDTVKLDKPDMAEAFRYIKREISQDPSKYKILSGVLFTTAGIDLSTGSQFHLYKNDSATKPIDSMLEQKLRNLRDPDVDFMSLAKSLAQGLAKARRQNESEAEGS